MNCKVCLFIIFGVAVAICDAQNAAPPNSQNKARSLEPYRNPRLSVDARIADLLSRMTLEEKVGQLEIPLGWEMYSKGVNTAEVSDHFKKMMQVVEPGTLYGVLRADPWTKVTLKTGLSPSQSADATNALQYYAIHHSRLHIPLLFAEECPHGHMAIGATVFPTAIGQASTWDPLLIRQMAAAVAAETRATGGNVCYGPILDIAREPRWSRVEETYGEDSFLTTEMGVSFVQGLQSAGLSRPDAVAATLKHFAGYGQPEGGHNSGPTHAGIREVETVFFPAFKASVKAGAASLMTSYNDIDGVPSTANEWLLTNVLRRQWGFSGYVASDLYAIDGLVSRHHVAENLEQAAALALNAGMDADLGANAFPQLVKAMKEGRVSSQTLNLAVARVLRIKFRLGLFESPYASPEVAARVVGSKEHIALARQVARESIVLLKNTGDLLPLSKHLDSIALIGPNADSVYNQLGDYTAPQSEGKVSTVFDGIRAVAAPGTVIHYAKGANIRGSSEKGFEEALAAVRQSSVAVVVLGGSSARNFNTLFSETGAAKPAMDASGSDMESGEGFDRASLGLAGVQEKLLKQIVAVGKPVVLVLIEGRPLELNWAAENVPAILAAWYPGEAGGFAIADVLFGDTNPAGRQPVSVPRTVGQLPLYYGAARADYIDSPGTPLFDFGYGLSYTKFGYANLTATVQQGSDTVKVEVSVDVSNIGTRPGDEVAQIYLHPISSSVVTPTKILRGFQRIHLDAGQTKTVKFQLESEDLAVFNQQGKWAVEAGTFELLAGGSSESAKLSTKFMVSRSMILH